MTRACLLCYTYHFMKYSSFVSLAALMLLGAGCGQATPITPPGQGTTSTATVPGGQVPPTTPPAPTPTPAPARTAETTISVTGDFNYNGRILVTCNAANPVSDPLNDVRAGWQFRGGSQGRDNGTGPYLRLNFHNGREKRAGVQAVGYEQGKASASVEWSPQEGSNWTSYFGADTGLTVTVANDFKSATVVGQMEEAINPAKKIQVNATVKCQ